MALNPKVQAKAQAEVDAYIGDRLPLVTDKGEMQYVEACIKENKRELMRN